MSEAPAAARLAAWWRAAWLGVALVIVAGSAGTWAPYAPGIWKPTLIVLRDVVITIALYVPFGLFGMLALGRSDVRGIVRVSLIALIFSAAVEASQLYTVDRVGSLTDIVCAVVGCVVGAATVVMVRSAR